MFFVVLLYCRSKRNSSFESSYYLDKEANHQETIKGDDSSHISSLLYVSFPFFMSPLTNHQETFKGGDSSYTDSLLYISPPFYISPLTNNQETIKGGDSSFLYC